MNIISYILDFISNDNSKRIASILADHSCHKHNQPIVSICMSCIKSYLPWQKCIFCSICSESHSELMNHNDYSSLSSIHQSNIINKIDALINSSYENIDKKEVKKYKDMLQDLKHKVKTTINQVYSSKEHFPKVLEEYCIKVKELNVQIENIASKKPAQKPKLKSSATKIIEDEKDPFSYIIIPSEVKNNKNLSQKDGIKNDNQSNIAKNNALNTDISIDSSEMTNKSKLYSKTPKYDYNPIQNKISQGQSKYDNEIYKSSNTKDDQTTFKKNESPSIPKIDDFPGKKTIVNDGEINITPIKNESAEVETIKNISTQHKMPQMDKEKNEANSEEILQNQLKAEISKNDENEHHEQQNKDDSKINQDHCDKINNSGLVEVALNKKGQNESFNQEQTIPQDCGNQQTIKYESNKLLENEPNTKQEEFNQEGNIHSKDINQNSLKPKEEIIQTQQDNFCSDKTETKVKVIENNAQIPHSLLTENSKSELKTLKPELDLDHRVEKANNPEPNMKEIQDQVDSERTDAYNLSSEKDCNEMGKLNTKNAKLGETTESSTIKQPVALNGFKNDYANSSVQNFNNNIESHQKENATTQEGDSKSSNIEETLSESISSKEQNNTTKPIAPGKQIPITSSLIQKSNNKEIEIPQEKINMKEIEFDIKGIKSPKWFRYSKEFNSLGTSPKESDYMNLFESAGVK